MTKQAVKGPDPIKIAEIMDEVKETKKEIPMEQKAEGLIVLDELRDLLDTLREEEFAELKRSIEDEGIRDPIVVWKEKNAIIDGHNRNKVAVLLGINPPTVEKSFPDVNAVKEWMLRNQLGRRNLTQGRFEYLLGKLYNENKQDPTKARTPTEDGKTTASVIASQFGVSERTVRRAGDVAKGIDKLAQVKGKLAKINQIDGKGDYTKEELATVGKSSNDAVAKKIVEKLDAVKKQAAAKKSDDKSTSKAASSAPILYQVALCAPDFDTIGFSVVNEPRPPLDKDAIVYMALADEHLATGMKLLERWGLTYECAFVYPVDPYEGVWSKVAHRFLIAGTKGTITGPKAGKEHGSVSTNRQDVEGQIVKMIDGYHAAVKKIDMRKGKSVPNGWSALAK